jgi:hypothetical protein
VIRFSAVLVTVAIGVLIGGGVTSRLSLVYIAILIAAVALITLAIGVVIKRKELFGQDSGLVPATAGAGPVLPVSSGDSWDRGGAAFGSAAPVAAPAASAPAADKFARTRADLKAAPTRTDLQAARASKSPPTRADLKAARTQVDLFGSTRAGTPGDTPAETHSAPAQTPLSWFDRLGEPTAPATPNPGADADEDTAGRSDRDEATPRLKPGPAEAKAGTAGAKASAGSKAGDETKAASPSSPATDDGAADPDATRAVPAFSASTVPVPPPPASAAATPAPGGPGGPDPDPEPAAVTEAADEDDAAEAGTTDTAEPADTVDTIETDDSEAADTASPVADGSEPPAASPSSDAGQVTVVRGVPRYHTSDCILIRFLPQDDLQEMTVPAATATGATPCAVCQHEG